MLKLFKRRRHQPRLYHRHHGVQPKRVMLNITSVTQDLFQHGKAFFRRHGSRPSSKTKWHKNRRLAFFASLAILLVLAPIIYLTLTQPWQTKAAPWATTATDWKKRKQVTLTNNSGQTLIANTTYTITVNTKELVDAGHLQADCSDLRVYYQPNDQINSKLAYYFDTVAGATNCADSEATKVYFPLQANLSNNSSAIEYYLYYDSPGATSEASVDAFDIGEKEALLVCPFNGDTECVNGDGAESPTTETGAIRYSGGKNALSFDGSNDHVSFNEGGSLSSLDYTIELWFKVSNTSSTRKEILEKDGNKVDFYVQGTSVYFHQWRHTVPQQVVPLSGDLVASGVGANTWHHVAITRSGTDSKIYLDGVLAQQKEAADFIGLSGTHYLGWYNSTNNAPIVIDELRLSSRARYTSNFTPQTTPFVRDEYTKLLLHFDENGDDPRNTGKAIDDSGNGNHGTITGAKYVAGLVGVDASTSDSGNFPSQSYASHDGVFIEEGTTNKVTNPSFEHTTYDTNWSAGGNITLTANTTSPYFKFGSKSAKLVASADDTFVTSLNPGNTNTHTLSAYVYDGTTGNVGGTVSATVAKLVFNGSVVTPSAYTDMGGGWWRLSYSAATTNSAGDYGVQALSGKTIYVDGVQLEQKAYATTYADGGLGSGYSWSGNDNESSSLRSATTANYDSTHNLSNTSGSVSFWVKTSNNASEIEVANTYQSLFQFGSGLWSDKFLILKQRWTNGITLIRNTGAYDPSRLKITSTSNSFSFGVWQHVVATWNSASGIKIYLNNGTAAVENSTNDWPNPSSIIKIAKGDYQSSDKDSNILVSDFRTFDTDITASEVASLYYSGLGSHEMQTDFTEQFSGQEEPTAYWKFDEGFGEIAYDSSQTGNNGVIDGATWSDDTFGSATEGKSLQFDGVDDHVYKAYANDIELDPGKLPFSTSVWFKAPSSVTAQQTLIARYAGSGYKVYMNASGQMCFGIDDDSTWGSDDVACSTQSFADSNWHLVTAIKGESSISLYVDAVQVATTPITANGGLSGSNPTFYVGIDSDGTSNPWKGFLDEVRTYSYALSTEQILTEFSARGSVRGVSTSFTGEGAEGALGQGLVGYWKMDEASWNGTAGEVIDSSGNGNHGVRSGDATTATGKFGKGGTFDGTGDYVPIGQSSSLGVTDEFTFSAWVKTSDSANTLPLISKGNLSIAGTTNKFAFGLYQGRVWAVYRAITGTTISTNTVSDNAWHHITWTFSKKMNKTFVYIDGKIDGEGYVSPTTTGQDSSDVKLGTANNYGYDYYHNGGVDELRVYNRALSPAEVQALYNWAPGPIGHWKFDEGTGTSAYDYSGKGNVGTMNGSMSESSWTVGQYSAGLQFNGADYLNISSSASIESVVSNKPWTVGFWAKAEDSGQQPYEDIAVAWGTHATGYQSARVGVTDTSFNFETYGFSATGITGDLTQWNYITVSYDGQNVKQYLNGQQKTSQAVALNVATGQPLSIGGSIYNYATRSFQGKIDDVKLFNYARTPQQIVEDMDAGHPPPGSPIGSPLVHYKFDEGTGTVANNAGSGGSTLNGTLTSMASPATTTSGWSNNGKFDKALSFDGSDDGVIVNTAVTSTLSDWTLSAWIYPKNYNQYGTIVYNGNDSGGYGLMLYNYSGNVRVLYGGVIWLDSGYTLPSLNTWYHILAKRDSSGTLSFYINGVKTPNTYTNTPNAPQPKFSVGMHYNSSNIPSRFFNGTIDEVKIYTSALTDDQVKAEYNMGKATVLGSLSTNATGVASNANDRSYCPPGDSTGSCGPVAEWKFDENTGTTTVNDASGNANHGTMNGGMTNANWVPGKVGSALSFDGNDHILVGDNNSLDTTGSVTLQAWIKPSSLTNYATIIGKRHASSTSANYAIRMGTGANSDEFEFYFANAGWHVYTTNNASLVANNWYFVTAVYDGSSVKIYKNGVLLNGVCSAGTCSASLVSDTNSVGIGRSGDFASEYYSGLIDQVRIYNYARTPAQIAWDYNRGKPVAHYKLDECSGTTIHSTNDPYSSALNGTWSGSGGSRTSAGDCSTANTAWGNGATGKLNASMNFDGADDRVLVSQAVTQPNFSYSFWMKPSGLPGSSAFIVSEGFSYTDSNYIALNSAGNLDFRIFASQIATNNAPIAPNNWYHVIGTYDGTNGRLYINGQLVKQEAASKSGSPDRFAIGGGTSGTNYFSGQIDDVQIFNYALTQQQIQTVMNSGAIRYGQ